MKRAFVTGGSGFLGGALLEALRDRGVAYMQKPINFDRLLVMLAEGQHFH